MRPEEGGCDDPPCPRNPWTRVSASSDLVLNSRSTWLSHWRSRPSPSLLLPWTGLVLHCTTSFVRVVSLIHPVRDEGAKSANISWPNLLMMHSRMDRRVIVDCPTLHCPTSLITSYHLRYNRECAGTRTRAFYFTAFVTETNDHGDLNTTRNRNSNPGPSNILLTH